MTRPAPEYQTILARDATRGPSDYYDHYPFFDDGYAQVDAARYFDPAFHQLEKERLWSRVWQLACREDEVAEAGDVLEYQIARRSYLIVRGDDGVLRGFPNACRHRGTVLCEGRTVVPQLRCRYHCFTWTLDGQLAHTPASWDFPHVDADGYRLPEIRLQS